MRFCVSVTGEHSEGHEAKSRFESIVAQFCDSLHANGFIPEHVLQTHDEQPFVEECSEPSNPEMAELAEETRAATDTEGEQAAILSIKFASVNAAALADEYNLTDTDFAGVEPSSAKGFLADDVRTVIKAKGQ